MGSVYTIPYLNYSGISMPSGAFKIGNWLVPSSPDVVREFGYWTTTSSHTVVATFYQDSDGKKIYGLFKSEVAARIYHVYIGMNSGNDTLQYVSSVDSYYAQLNSTVSSNNGTFEWYIDIFPDFQSAYNALFYTPKPWKIVYEGINCFLNGPEEADNLEQVSVDISLNSGMSLLEPSQGKSISVYYDGGYIDFGYTENQITFTTPSDE